MRPPLTKSQIERLGVRLVQGTKPTDADRKFLHEVLSMYSEVLAGAVDRVRDGAGLSPTSRIKNTGTILEKLRRNGGHGLKTMQDLAGMRIVVRSDRRGQDVVVQQLVELFGEDARPSKVVDRRATPVHGYRAVHVIAFPDGVPVEIQARTLWQHEWAELFEKLADRVGRGIRYGDPPAISEVPTEVEAIDAIQQSLVSLSHVRRTLAVERALEVADLIDAVETSEATMPENPRLGTYRQRVDDELLNLRRTLEAL